MMDIPVRTMVTLAVVLTLASFVTCLLSLLLLT